MRIHNKNALRNALIDPEDNLNYAYFQGKDVNMSEVVDLINTMPFLSERRVVLCENTGWLEKVGKGGDDDSAEADSEASGGRTEDSTTSGDNAAGGTSGSKSADSGSFKMLTDALGTISEDVVFVLCEEKVDKRSKLYKFMQKNARCEEFSNKTPEELMSWIAGYLNKAGKKIRPDAAAYLVSEVGNDMTLLSLELEKLIAYGLDREEVTMDDIDTMCTHRINDRIFDMITAISDHRQKEALSLYYDLVNLRESPFHILALLIRQYNNLLAVREGVDNGYSYIKISEGTHIQDWLVKKMIPVVRRMTYKQIVNALSECVSADEGIKTGNITDTLAIELLIINLSAASKTA